MAIASFPYLEPKSHGLFERDFSRTGNGFTAATVLVSWDAEGQRKIHEFHGPVDGFATQKDSESWGVEFGKKWINDGNPDFTSPVDI
jgi:hypothetical protein